jgi:hypothetical protein
MLGGGEAGKGWKFMLHFSFCMLHVAFHWAFFMFRVILLKCNMLNEMKNEKCDMHNGTCVSLARKSIQYCRNDGKIHPFTLKGLHK